MKKSEFTYTPIQVEGVGMDFLGIIQLANNPDYWIAIMDNGNEEEIICDQLFFLKAAGT